jgi:hypothetical protein
MVFTRQVVALARPDTKVTCLSLSEDGTMVAWTEGRNTVIVGLLDSEATTEMLCTIQHPNPISTVLLHRSHVVVGDDLDGVSFYSHSGEPLEHQAIDGGVQSLKSWGLKLAAISGMGEVFSLQFERSVQPVSANCQLDDCIDLVQSNDRLYVATQSGRVVATDGEQVLWSRPARGEMGERITALGVTTKGSLFLTREGHALVAGDEEAIEFELWTDEVLKLRIDQRMRLLTSSPASQGAVLGFDDGTVQTLDEEGRLECLIETGHPVFSCLEVKGHVLASSWFYVHGWSADVVWKVEHQGMPRLLCGNSESSTVLFAGDDQNDYTDSEPIGSLSLDGEVFSCDPAELSLWFEAVEQTPPPSAEELYGASDDDVLQHLTEDEQRSLASNTPVGMSSDVLLEAMGQESVESSEASVESSIDAAALLNDLQGLTELTLEDEELDAAGPLSDVHRPRAVAGDDQRQMAESDGTVVVLLDGRGTHDPHQHIIGWSWLNEQGVELSSTSQLKLRLPIGLHRFELRVVDKDGSWTTDTTVITVFDGSTS